jgi:peptidoglycan/LPS O-acetylase OafA/YrhL
MPVNVKAPEIKVQKSATVFIYNGKKHIQSLDGWRAISILLVILGHIGSGFKMKGLNANVEPKWLNYLPDAAYAFDGVNAFFVISGFLITSLLITEKKKTSTVSIRRFYLKRMFRIFPVFYLYLLLIAFLNANQNWHIPLAEFIQNLLYLNNFQIWGASTILLHSWSLSIEEQYYLTWPLVIKFVQSHAALLVICIIMVLISCCSRWLVYYEFRGDIFNPSTKAGIITNNLISDLFVYLDAILIGAIVALLTAGYDGRKMFTRKSLTALLLIGTGLLYILADLGEKKGFGLPYPLVFARTIKSACFATWMLYSICRSSWLSKVLNIQLLQKIGLWSYSLYIWQQLFLIPMMVNNGDGNKVASNTWFNSLPQNVFILLAVALISYYGFEKPILNLRNRLISTRKTIN